jgi:hypothetical protein
MLLQPQRIAATASAIAATVILVTVGAATVSVATASAATYTATETIPVPPASTYQGSGGGDGWAVALSTTQVFNVFHHNTILEVACHLQATAQPCWEPETITEPPSGASFGTSGQPGLYLDQATGRLYVYATRMTDGTGGVVCIATNEAATNTDPFCGFTALTGVGEASTTTGISNISDPAVVGQRWFAFNYFGGAASTGTENKLLCFSLVSFSACSGQPYSVGVAAGSTDSDGAFPPPAVAAFGNEIIVPILLSTETATTQEFGCFNGQTQNPCSGSWPVTTETFYDSEFGAPFPLLTSVGALSGFCLPSGLEPCWTLGGATTTAPTGLAEAIGTTSDWNGPAQTIGSRVYVPDGNTDTVQCYDYSKDAGCPEFPHLFPNLGLLYTVNTDPQRPTCLWVNSDDGSGQIQNFDAFTTGSCGRGVIRVLASHLITTATSCTPSSYVSMQVVSPSPSQYTSGSITFEDSGGNPIPGASEIALSSGGIAILAGLNLNAGNGLPQFVISLVGAPEGLGSVVVKLTWERAGAYNPSCLNGGTYVALGDSYSAGQGNPGTYLAPTNQPGDECHRSAVSYPFDVEIALAYFSQRFSFHACSGAKIEDFSKPNHEFPVEPKQLYWLEGARGTKASLVTFTIGGNNANFAKVAQSCFINALEPDTEPCQNQWNAPVNAAITRMGTNSTSNPESLTQLYTKVAVDAPNATILVLGYPRFFPASPPASCSTGSLWTKFTAAQLQWMNNEVRSIDNMTARAVRETLNPRVRYVETYEAFRGHERCESDPWLNGINFPGHDISGSLHPNIEGQAALAKIVEKAAG